MATYRIRIFAEYESGLPLWTADDEVEAPAPSAIPILHALRRDLEAWNLHWDHVLVADSDDATDWSVWPPALAWNAEGYELARKLRSEVGEAVEIIYYDRTTGDDVTID